ncbi:MULTISPECIES: hypothetical protein [unclassified Arthrobacter]|uniref:hypothetical protein n=1 Tax=unclassified Arthrobacter TaxID=235627 RepID=UPI001D13E3EB|nr:MULTISPECIES: hypothetical protein [unclassified Arthrobacter]MCC3290883.1 hypothetical protein [Arthrobacter sp. zg-Y1110]MCC3301718.1 hypothetical protein [Arthrobacter sp. zg-Y895]UWX86298.1 hypothetical protein N2K99_07245 [Arthrobacter sp. zg-Y1110]
MDTNTLPQATVNARSILLPYTLALVAAMLLVQAVISLTGGDVDLLAGGLTAVVAVGIALWMWRNARKVTRIRFGFAVAHAIAFVTVTTSFNVHAVLRAFTAGGDGAAAAELLATPWFGATLVMSAAWGLGLLIHLTGAVLGRGWED